MRAAVHTRYGPPDVVRIAEVEPPPVGDRDVLVKVVVATVNRTDCGFRAAKPFFIRALTGLTRPKSTVLGGEFAGTVAAKGSGVTSFELDDRVFGYHGNGFGAHAEYLSMPEDGAIATIPAGLGFEEAAPSTEGSHYALTMIHGADIRTGTNVLVHGATGAIGSAAVQLLKNAGALVTATCDTAHIELVMGLGANRVIDHTATDFTRDEQTYDVVVDAVGKSSFTRCRRLLKPRGIYLSSDLGPLWMNPILGLITPLLAGRRVKMPIPRNLGREGVMHIRRLLETGAFKPVVDRRFRLDEIVDAYRYVETGRKIGNVLLSVADT